MDRIRRVPVAPLAALSAAVLLLSVCGTSDSSSRRTAERSLVVNAADTQRAESTTPVAVEPSVRDALPRSTETKFVGVKPPRRKVSPAPPGLFDARGAVPMQCYTADVVPAHRGPAPYRMATAPSGRNSQTDGRQAAHRPVASPAQFVPIEHGVAPYSAPPKPRSPRIEQVARRADQHSRHAFELAGRKAYYSARSEFMLALRMIAAAWDDERGTNVHTTALARGIQALEEADDFAPRGSQLATNVDVPSIVKRHQTPCLKGVDLRGVTPSMAFKRYHTYAQEQLGVSVAREMAGSMALHGLGKVQTVLASGRSPDAIGEAKAIALERAAVLANPYNFMASNDLGVLLARTGRHDQAREVLLQSLSVINHPDVWRNLAVVHQMKGETRLAELAMGEARIAVSQRAASGTAAGQTASAVQWLPAAAFASASPPPAVMPGKLPPAAHAPAAQTPPPADKNTSTGIMSWLPWKFKRE